MGQQKSPSEDNTNPDAEILEQGDIYFFYRPKKDAEEVKGVEDVRRFFMVTAPEKRSGGGEERNSSDNKSDLYRLFIIGKKSLPEVRKTEARVSERYWARVGGIFKDANELTKELLSADEFRRGDDDDDAAARPVGEGKVTALITIMITLTLVFAICILTGCLNSVTIVVEMRRFS